MSLSTESCLEPLRGRSEPSSAGGATNPKPGICTLGIPRRNVSEMTGCWIRHRVPLAAVPPVAGASGGGHPTSQGSSATPSVGQQLDRVGVASRACLSSALADEQPVAPGVLLGMLCGNVAGVCRQPCLLESGRHAPRDERSARDAFETLGRHARPASADIPLVTRSVTATLGEQRGVSPTWTRCDSRKHVALTRRRSLGAVRRPVVGHRSHPARNSPIPSPHQQTQPPRRGGVEAARGTGREAFSSGTRSARRTEWRHRGGRWRRCIGRTRTTNIPPGCRSSG